MKKLLLSTVILSFVFTACEKDEPKTTTTTTDQCASKTIDFSSSFEDAGKCLSNGQIIITATGSTGFTYQLGTAAFQTSNTFQNLKGGTYSVTVKDVDGCTKTKSVTLNEAGTMGAKFTDVKALVALRCNTAQCHASTGGAPKIFTTDCDIVSKGTKMKEQAVDGGMGGLTQTEKNVISSWLTAGGKFTD